MFAGISDVLSTFLHGLLLGFLGVGPVIAFNQAVLAIPDSVLNAAVGGFAVIGLFIDLPTLFTVVGVLLAWRGVWTVYRLYRTIKDAVPVVG